MISDRSVTDVAAFRREQDRAPATLALSGLHGKDKKKRCPGRPSTRTDLEHLETVNHNPNQTLVNNARPTCPIFSCRLKFGRRGKTPPPFLTDEEWWQCYTAGMFNDAMRSKQPPIFFLFFKHTKKAMADRDFPTSWSLEGRIG